MKYLMALLLISCSCYSFAQSDADRERALTLAREAITLMDDGEYEPSLKLLREAEQLDPDNATYPYEIGYAYYLQKDYKSAIKVMKKALKVGKRAPQMYSIVGNSYDYLGKQKKAVKIYEEGIKRYPESAIFHVELGILHYRQQDYNTAAAYWEAGIRADPNYPSNYFHLTSLFSNTDEHIWTVLYGEMFLNLEAGSERTEMISSLVCNAYRKAIQLEGDTTRIAFSRNVTMSISDFTDLKLPAPLMFGTTMEIATTVIAGGEELNCTTLHKLRSSFLTSWYEMGHNVTYPNPAIERMKAVADAGHLEPYNYYIVGEGDRVGWEFWVDSHKEEFSAFVEWFVANPLKVEKDKAFTRSSF